MVQQNVPLTTLADSVTNARLIGGQGEAVSGLAYDSRRVTPGSLYVAIVGSNFDGHSYITAALEAGAAAIVIQADRYDRYSTLPVPRIVVPSTRTALAPLACRFYGDPTHHLYLAGVTGTNGKTTTSRMIDSIARAAGETTGVLGTIGATIDGRDYQLPGDRTTPEAPDLQRLFSDMLERGVQSAAMEVASHALSMGRTEGCAFDVAVFTNLTQDHLDFHGTMESYRDAKAMLFTDYADAARAVGKEFVAVLNADNEVGEHYARITRAARTVRFGVRDGGNPVGPAADIIADDIERSIDSITYRASTPAGEIQVSLPFGGGFNIENSLAAVGYGVARGFSAGVIAAGLAHCPPVPGRFQPVRAGQDFALLVDYAHTPDGLENVLRSARPLTDGKLIVVFGCGGDRDRTKRPKMGRLALELADVAIVTSDNPRNEDPDKIIDDVLAGMEGPGATLLRRTDRRAAIAKAVQVAEPGDTIVIAGKGHESYQIIGNRTLPFDDVSVAREEIQRAA